MKSEDRGAELLNAGARLAHGVAHLAEESRESWAEPCPVFDRNDGFVDLSAPGAFTSMQHEVSDREGNLGKLDHLVGVVGLRIREIIASAAGANLGLDLLHLSGVEKSLTESSAPEPCSGFLVLLGILLARRRIRGGRFAGIR